MRVFDNLYKNLWKYCEYKWFRILLWIIAYINVPIFKIKYYFYSKKRKTKKIVRLFDTTGCISLINSLAIIKEDESDKYEDILLLDSCSNSIAFIKKHLKIAKIHNFKRIIIPFNIPLKRAILAYNIYQVNEVYALNHPKHLPELIELYPNTPFKIIDEGAGALVNAGIEKCKNISEIRTVKYLDKMDFARLNNIEKYKFNPINMNIFREITQKIIEEESIDLCINTEDKYVLYCGVYWYGTGLSQEEFANVQKEMLNNLIKQGYKVIYKPHPRDKEFYGFDKNTSITFFDTKYPIELYKIDVLAVVSYSSNTSISEAHYWNIPGFSNVLEKSINKKDKFHLNINRLLVKEYSPNYNELLKLDVKNMSKNELKLQIKKIHENFIKNKPLLSENEKIKEYENYDM